MKLDSEFFDRGRKVAGLVALGVFTNAVYALLEPYLTDYPLLLKFAVTAALALLVYWTWQLLKTVLFALFMGMTEHAETSRDVLLFKGIGLLAFLIAIGTTLAAGWLTLEFWR